MGRIEELERSPAGDALSAAILGQFKGGLPAMAGRLVEAAEQQGISPVLACSPQLRLPLMRLLKAGSRRIQVLSYTEISGCTAQIETMGVVHGAYATVA